MRKKENVLQNESPIVLFTSVDGAVHVNVRLGEETVWLTQAAMAELFDCTVDNISLHLKNIYDSGELTPRTTTEDFSVVRLEGNRRKSEPPVLMNWSMTFI